MQSAARSIWNGKTLAMYLVITGICLLGTATIVLADGAAGPAGGGPAGGGAAAGQPPQPSFIASLLPIVLIFGVFYFLVLRPQKKRMEEHKKLVESVKQGDQIVTQSGLLGYVRGQDEKLVTLEIADDVKVRLLRSQIATVVDPDKGVQELQPAPR
jgi:preprotein translocase subunit YajC